MHSLMDIIVFQSVSRSSSYFIYPSSLIQFPSGIVELIVDNNFVLWKMKLEGRVETYFRTKLTLLFFFDVIAAR